MISLFNQFKKMSQAMESKACSHHLLRRILARLLDYSFFYSLLILPLFFTSLIPNEMLHLMIGALIPLFWIPIEAFLLSTFGTTPGKSLLGLHIKNDQEDTLRFHPALKRSLNIWLSVLACSILPLTIFSSYRSYKQLKRFNKLKIDQKLSSTVYLKKSSKIRVAIASALVFLYSIFFLAEYEMRDVLISDKSFFSSKLFKEEAGMWTAFNDPRGEFVIHFPSSPKTHESALPTSEGKDPLPLSEIKIVQDKIEYNLSYTILPKSLTKWGSSLVLKGSLKLLAKHTPGGAKIYKKSTTKFKNHPAIDFILIRKGGFESMGRLVLIKSKLYKVEVTFPANKKTEIAEKSNIFLQSFTPK